MNKIVLIVLLIATGQSIYAQTIYTQIDSLAILKNTLVEGKRMTNAFLKGNYEAFAEFSPPKLLEMMGGKDKMIEMLNEQNEINEVKDMLINTELSLPQRLIIQDSIYQCAIPQKQIMNFDDQKFFTLSSLVAISYNSGKKWYFISATKSLTKMQTLFPELSNDLEIIEQTPPMPYLE